MTTFAEEVTQHLELFIKHLTNNNKVIDEYNEEFLVDATIISLKTRGTIQISLRRNKSKNDILHLHQRIQAAAILQIHARSKQSSPSTQ